MKAAPSMLFTFASVALGMAIVQPTAAQSAAPVSAAAPAPSPPQPPEPGDVYAPQREKWEKQVELEMHQAAHEVAAAAKEAEEAAAKIFLDDLPINVNVDLGRPGAPSGRIQEAAKLVSEAPDKAAKAAATTNLRQRLDEYFESDMHKREQQLIDIQARVQRLRTQLEHRRAKKQEIIDLQAKVAINEAEGLGFYGDRKPSGFDFAVPVPVATPTGTTISMPNEGTWTSEPSSSEEPATPATASNAEPQ